MQNPGRPEVPGLAALVVLLALAALVLLPSAWSAGVLNFDDDLYYGAASPLREGLSRALDPGQPVANAWLPVTHVSIWLDLHLFDGPRAWHLHSLLLHVLAAWCLARVLGRLGLRPIAATAAAAAFLVHPALVECSLWLSSRKDLLAGIFTFVALEVVVVGQKHGRIPWRTAGIAALVGACALLSKGSALVLPLLAAVAVWLAGGERRRGVPAVAALFAVAAVLGGVHVSIAASEGTMLGGATPGERLAGVPGAFLHYVTTAVWPTGTNVLYPELATLGRFTDRLVPGLAVCAAWIAAVVLLRRRAPEVAAGLAWFGLALLPYNTAFPASSIAAADRYLYLAIPGLALALGSLRRPPGALLCAVLVLPLAWLSLGRAADFGSSEAVWRSSLARDPSNAVALLNLAHAVSLERPRDPEPDALLERAVAVEPHYPIHRARAASALAERASGRGRFDDAYRYAAIAAHATGRLGDSELALELRIRAELAAARFAMLSDRQELSAQHVEAARAIAPEHPLVLASLASRLVAEACDPAGRASTDDPRIARARELLDRALAASPHLYEAHQAAAELARSTGAVLSAEKHYSDAIRIAPTRPEAHLGRADLFLGQGMGDAAAAAARDALALGVAAPGIRYRLALGLGQQGRLEDARQHYESYLSVRPGDREAELALAKVTAAIGHQQLYQLPPAELEAMAKRVRELDPENARGRLMQAVAARGRGDMLAARVLLERLFEEAPGDPEIRKLYAETLRDRGWHLKLREQRDDAAFDAFVRFLEVAPASVPTDAVQQAVEQEWSRRFELGQKALLARELEVAERELRRCLELRPGIEAPYLHLGLTLLQKGEEHAAEALRCFERASAGQRERDADASLSVFYEVLTLKRMGDEEEAARRGEALLAQPGPADEHNLDRIRMLIQ